MFMKKMRNSAKYVMLVLSFAFVGWLVFEGINDMRGGNLGGEINPVVGEVSGTPIRYSVWNSYLENQLALARNASRGLTDEEIRVITDRAWESLVSLVMLQTELNRLDIVISDAEIQQAFLNQPPPEMYTHPAFQTDGQFDIEKYRRFFTDPSTNETQLLQIEQYYRSLLPRAKLEELVEGGVYVSDEEAWQFYRDTNETARIRFVRVDPLATIPDSAITITSAEIRDYYNAHRDDFEIPASARTNMVSIALRASPEDTLAARMRAAELRQRIADGEDFAEVAMAESADSVSAVVGGDMGRRALSVLDPTLVAAASDLAIGRVSDPVETSFGLHILRVDDRWGDSIQLRQIYVPIEISNETEDRVFALMDDIEDIALKSDLVTAADSVGVPVRTDVSVSEDIDFIPGAGALGVAPDWALDPLTEIGELSRFFENPGGFHVFELLGRQEAGRAALEDVTPNIRQILSVDKKKAAAAELAGSVTEALATGASLDEAAGRFGWTVSESQEFRRGDFVPGIGQGTEAIGVAFGTPVGGISGVVDAGDGVAIVQVVDRTEATREGFDEVKQALLGQLVFERTQDYVQKWLLSLRETATVEDHRQVLQQNLDEASGY
ncbi:MAG: peptidyl-prolyl cis-trans isomerase [Gemmatimonadota bacterium]